MGVREWRTIDKQAWGPGPWQDEADKVQWVDEATGLDCLIVRNGRGHGALCGYVGVPESHPWFGKDYGECTLPECAGWCSHSPGSLTDVHGGLTFADSCRGDESNPGVGICHMPEPGRPEHVWWFGFDCAHAGDVCPAYAWKYPEPHDHGATYKGREYVAQQCASLAGQLARVTLPAPTLESQSVNA